MKEAKPYLMPENIVHAVFPMIKKCKGLYDLPYDDINTLISPLREYLSNTDLAQALEDDGIIQIKPGEYEYESQKIKMIFYSSLFYLVNNVLITPEMEPKNLLPFTVFKCSADNPSEMKAAGVRFYSPDTKLGYHNDVFIKGNRFFIPKYVSLMNLFIGYANPGHFYYINHKIWDDFDYFYDKGKNRKYKFRPTPVVHESNIKSGMTSDTDQWYKTPVFWRDQKTKSKIVFCNGELKDIGNEFFIEQLKLSLLNNNNKIYVPQSEGVISLFRNDFGFHSRDIFQDQRIFTGTTRMFLRSVSSQAFDIPDIEQENEYELEHV